MADTEPDGSPERAAPGAGLAGLSLPSQLIIAVAVAVAVLAVAVHLAMAFLDVAPSNTITKKHGKAVDDYVYPEFERNWKLFAPDPLQQNIAIQARAEVSTPEGGIRTTHWTDLSAQDGAAIHHNPLPSHTQQNELRRAWESYALSHDAQNHPEGLRGELSEQYVRRIVVHRFGVTRDGGTVQRVQVRSATASLAPPPWSDEKIDTRPVYRTLPWWTVTPDDLGQGGGR